MREPDLSGNLLEERKPDEYPPNIMYPPVAKHGFYIRTVKLQLNARKKSAAGGIGLAELYYSTSTVKICS